LTSNLVDSTVSFKNGILIGRQYLGEEGRGFFQTIVFISSSIATATEVTCNGRS